MLSELKFLVSSTLCESIFNFTQYSFSFRRTRTYWKNKGKSKQRKARKLENRDGKGNQDFLCMQCVQKKAGELQTSPLVTIQNQYGASQPLLFTVLSSLLIGRCQWKLQGGLVGWYSQFTLGLLPLFFCLIILFLFS